MLRDRLAFSPILGAVIATGAAMAILGYILPTTPARADLLIVAPHPDDDLITSAGLILRARQAGEVVWVLFMTNGDVMGMDSGRQRQDEAVAALDLLHVPEDNIIFLGYPDGSLEDLRGPYLAANTTRAAANHDGQTTTFGDRGLGRAEYHRHIFGDHATNNGTNLRVDLTHVLSSYHPAHIFVTSEHDAHPDHRTTYHFVLDAVAGARDAAPSYNPTIHKTIVWNDFSNQLAWPAAANAAVYFTEPPNLQARTGLIWAQRESLDVPLEMQVATLTENLKWRAINAHTSQGGNNGYIGQWVHKDEFFWTERTGGGSNRPPVPNAGTDRSAGRGARVQLDGSASFDPDGNTLSYQWRQVGQPSVALADASTARPSFTVPRGTAEGTMLVFELRVGDGTSTSVADALSVRAEGTVVPEPDAGTPQPDAGTPRPDAGTPQPDAGTPQPDAGPRVDAGQDASTPQPDSGAGGDDAGTSEPDAMTGGALDAGLADGATNADAADEIPSADAEPIPGEDTAEPGDDDGSADPARDAGDKAAHDDDAGDDSRRRDRDDGCSVAVGKRSTSAAWPLLLALAWLGARRRRRAGQYGS